MHTAESTTPTSFFVYVDMDAYEVDLVQRVGGDQPSDIRDVQVLYSTDASIKVGRLGALIREKRGWTPVAYKRDGSIRGWGVRARNRVDAVKNLMDLVWFGPNR